MKLTAMSRAYVTRTISKKAEARKAEISAEIERIMAERKELVARARAMVEREIREMSKRMVREFKEIGLTWLDHEYNRYASTLRQIDEKNVMVCVDVGENDFAETTSVTGYASRDSKAPRAYADARLQQLQAELDNISARVTEEIERAIFTIETSRADVVSIEKIIADIAF